MSAGSLEEVQCLEGHTDRVWQVSWSPSGEDSRGLSRDTAAGYKNCLLPAAGAHRRHSGPLPAVLPPFLP